MNHRLTLSLIVSIVCMLGANTAVARSYLVTSTTLSLQDVEVDPEFSFFVYTLIPKGSKVSINLYSIPGRGERSLLASKANTSTGEWLIFEFGQPKSEWGQNITVDCVIDSEEPQNITLQRTFLYTLLSNEGTSRDNLNRNTNTRFEPTPINKPDIASGEFFYDLPWPSVVTIQVFKKLANGSQPTKVVIQDLKNQDGVTKTKWDGQNSFNTMKDGQYEAKITCKEIAPSSAKPAIKTVYTLLEFARGIK